MTIPTLRADDKVVVITGGSKGLGRAMALGFAGVGADVVVASRKLEPCEQVAAEIRALGRRALAVSCHVGDWTQCEDLVAATVTEIKPAARDACVPKITRDRTSRPRSSVPNQCAALGAARIAIQSGVFGS